MSTLEKDEDMSVLSTRFTEEHIKSPARKRKKEKTTVPYQAENTENRKTNSRRHLVMC